MDQTGFHKWECTERFFDLIDRVAFPFDHRAFGIRPEMHLPDAVSLLKVEKAACLRFHKTRIDIIPIDGEIFHLKR